MKYHGISHATRNRKYRIVGIFFWGGGVKFSWMLGFVVIRGKVVGSSLNHTPRACVEQWPLVSERNLWYEVTTSIKSEMHKLANNYFPSS